VAQQTPYVLHLDGGSVVTRRQFENELIDAMSVRALIEMDCAATTIGAYDLFRGLEYYKSLISGTGLAVVSANVYDESTGDLAVQPYVIVDRAGIRFAVTGALNPEADIRTDREVKSLGAVIGDPKESLAAILPELREKADFVVLLSQLGLDKTKLLAEELPGLDFVLIGETPQYSAETFEVGGAVMLQPGYKGQRICDSRLEFGPEAIYEGSSGKVVDLGDKVPSDAAMALLLKEHKIAVEEASKQRALANKPTPSQARPQEKYVEECLGVEASCVRCHQTQYQQWKSTAHSGAFATLEEGHQSTNPECLRCHVTCHLDLPADGSVSVREELRNVQCEACHGKATEHARDGSYGNVTVATCKTCHDQENSPDFDFATYLPKVTH
ncbi:MAG: hypothetical protein JXB46_05600, partial [Candidatus Eisenbacteria bacterium]|nr:hypothetical protein [Candidatus Eisenbacteria bacterium]